MERCAASVGGDAAARRDTYHALPAIRMSSAAIPQSERRQRRTLFRCGRLYRRRRLRLGGDADLQRVNPHRLGDVLELGRAEVCDREIKPSFDLTVGVFGKTDRAGLGDAFEPSGDIDPVAHQVAVGLLDDIAEMDADAELYAALGRHAGVALDHAVLHLDRAAHSVDHAAKLDEAAVARALDDAPVMRGDGGIDQVAAEPPEPRQGAILVRARQPAVADHVRNQDRSNLPDFGHGAPSRVMQNTTETGQSRRPLVASDRTREAARKRTTESQLRGEKSSFAVEVFPRPFHQRSAIRLCSGK